MILPWEHDQKNNLQELRLLFHGVDDEEGVHGVAPVYLYLGKSVFDVLRVSSMRVVG